ncbi:MAG TPA: hypothetical protein VGK59_05720 [Ohtaekwangia sp.]
MISTKVIGRDFRNDVMIRKKEFYAFKQPERIFYLRYGKLMGYFKVLINTKRQTFRYLMVYPLVARKLCDAILFSRSAENPT